MTSGEYLKFIRKQLRFTIKEVALRSKGILDCSTISRIESDDRKVSLKTGYALARIYDLNLEQLAENMINRKIDRARVPFRTSVEDRALVEAFRTLPKKRREVVFDIVRSLSQFPHAYSPRESEIKVDAAIADFQVHRAESQQETLV